MTSATERFDTFLMLGNNLGLLAGQAGTAGLIQVVEKLASPEARIVGTIFDPYEAAEDEHLTYHEHNRRLGRPPGQSRIRIRYGAMATDWFDYLLATLDELAQLLSGTGWSIAESHKAGPHQAVVLVRA